MSRLSHTAVRVSVLAVLTVLAGTSFQAAAATGTWTPLTNFAPVADVPLLLTDGSVMVEQGDGTAWYKLKPDASGSYINGTWTALASMNDSRLYFFSVVLPDGRVLVGGGEYGTGTNSVEIYDPVANAWTRVTSWVYGDIGDSTAKVLPDGRVIVLPRFGGHWIYDPKTDVWTAGSGKGNNDEQSVAQMGDGNFLVAWDGSSQKYISATNQWVTAASPPNGLIGAGSEIGPSVLLYDGRVFCLGANGNTDIYTESADPTALGTFVAGPNIPNGLMCDDAPACVMPNGHVLFVADHGNFSGPASIFEYDPSTNAYTDVGGPSGGVAYTYRMLMLPSGQVLVSNGGSIQIYTPVGGPSASWRPTISSITQNSDGTFKVTGTQLNGLTEGAYYGDDAQMSSNYPIIRLTSGSNVYYAKSYNFSSMGVATGSATVSASFKVTGIPNGSYSLSAVANGIASTTVAFNIGSQVPLITSALTASSGINKPFSYTITASNTPTSFNATGLPAGLSVNTATGVISGSPTVAGTFNVSISATNSSGTGSATLVLTIFTAPVITSSLVAGGPVSTPFSYTITASNSPASFNATGLPPGLSVNTATGVISGTPTTIGTYTVTISATNSVGTGSATLTITITNGLVLYWKLDETSGATASDSSGSGNSGTLNGGGTWTTGKVGGGLNFNGNGQYAVTNNDLSKAFSGGSVTIALWFKANAAGVIVDELGQPALNSSWHDSQLEILADGSVYARVWNMTGVLLGNAAFGQWYHVALRYDGAAQKLDGFLNGVQSAGFVNGVKQWPGALYYALGGNDSTNLGSGAYFNGVQDDVHIYSRALSASEIAALAVNPTPTISSASSASVHAGAPFSYTITATNSPTSFNATGLPAGLSVNTATGVISGAVSATGSYSITISATNSSGTGSATLSLSVTDTAPVITSPAAANPNPANVNQAVAFTVSASDADGDPLTYSWTFGDGAVGSGASASHTYTVPGNYTATVTVSDGHGGTVTSSVSIVVGNVSVTASATYVTTDRTTQGNWKGVYGSDGYAIEADSTSLPSYASLAFANQATYTWNPSTTDVRAPLKAASSTDRIASCWYNNSSYTIDLNLSGSQAHQVAFYALDWDSTTRTQTFTITDTGSGTVLDGPRALSSYNGGAYVVWNIKGHVTITLTCTGGYNAVVSGIFFGTGNATTDTVWVEDVIPAGGIPQSDGGDSWNWVSANPAPFSGNLASQSNVLASEHQHYFTNATDTLSINTGDTLIAYAYLDPVNTPSEIMLQWNDGSWEHRAYWGANNIGWGNDGTVSRHFMGALPAAGQWVRLQVPASVVGLEGSTLNGMAFTLYGGQATWDHAGKGPMQVVSNDTIWVEDALPTGGIAQSDGGDAWTWVSSNPTPYSGNLASQSNLSATEHQHYFTGATQTLTVNAGDTLIAYVYLDPVNTPSEIMLQWNNGSWEHRAYWGANNIGWGNDGTVSRHYMGVLPAAGQWIRLEVPASVVGLEGSTLNGMAFTLYGGQATWDHAGKGPAQTVVVNDNLWVEDALPGGAVAQADGGDTWNWIGANPAPYSGLLASQSNVASGEHQHYFYGASQTFSVSTGDTLIAYVYLDPASVPSEVMLQWNNGSWEHRAYWGANNIGWGTDGTISRHYMGALPAAGKWVRLQVPASVVGLEGATLNGMAFTLAGGRATWDHAGKGPFLPVAPADGAPEAIDPALTPDANAAPVPAVNVFRLQAAVSYAKAGRDVCTLSGTISGVPPFTPAGQFIALDVNGVQVGFTLDAKGKGTNALGSILVKQKSGTVTFVAALKSGSWAGTWNLDTTQSASNVPTSMNVTVDLGTTSYIATVKTQLSAKAHIGGKLRK